MACENHSRGDIYDEGLSIMAQTMCSVGMFVSLTKPCATSSKLPSYPQLGHYGWKEEREMGKGSGRRKKRWGEGKNEKRNDQGWWHTPLISARRRQRQAYLCDLEVSLVYTLSLRSTSAIQ